MIITFFSVLFLGIWTGLLSLVKGIGPSKASRTQAPMPNEAPLYREAPTTHYEAPAVAPRPKTSMPQSVFSFNEEPKKQNETPLHYELRRLAFAIMSLLNK